MLAELGLLRGGRQFLPQDKVASFAQLRPDELLVETERAVGDAALHALHMDLIESRGELAALERARAPTRCACTRVYGQERAGAVACLSQC